MIKNRTEYILEQLNSKGSVKVNELSQELLCSEVTIRNDIKRLEEKGLLKRTHGGAVKVKEQLAIQIGSGNIYKDCEKKKRIAERAYEYINDQETIVLDDSSISYYLAICIRENNDKHLVVITNSIAVVSVLSSLDKIVLFMIGGQIGGKLPAAMGEIALDTISKFKADKAFVSAHGVSFDAGITSIGSPQMQVKKAILSVADKVYVLVDSSKFGGGYIMVVCPLERIERIITDKEIEPQLIQQAANKKVALDVV